jgi:Fe-S oxidoreductase/nitrate reductase gamma subunit
MPLADETLTREVFGNVSAGSRAVFYVLAIAATAILAFGLARRARLWRRGRPVPRPTLVQAARHVLRDVVLQGRVGGRGVASFAHRLLFAGFVVLLIGTALIAVEHVLATALGRPADQPVFHQGAYYAMYEATLDLFGLLFLAGCVLLAMRRWRRPESLAHAPLDWCVLALLMAIGVTGYVVEGLRILAAETPRPEVSFVGLGLARTFQSLGADRAAAASGHVVAWWVHAVCALGLIAVVPYTRLLHAAAGAANLAYGPHRLGEMRLVALEEFERTGVVGVGAVEQFSRRQLLELDACVACGRCEEACPAFAAGKPLSPRDVVQNLRGHLEGRTSALHGEAVTAETLWSCTCCSACVDVCPLDVNPLAMITDLRRFLVAEGELRGPPAAALTKTARSGNPWGLLPQDRTAWASGLDVPTARERPDFEVLYWIGCAAAYDRRVQSVAKCVVRLLAAAGVRFAILGSEERCTGESMRRMGDEFLFQELARANIAALGGHRVKRILTHCPHCLNTFRQDYPLLGGRYEVVHHAPYLLELAASGRLPLQAEGGGAAGAAAVTLHDPCYLARVAGVTGEPRELLRLASPGSPLVELSRHGRQTACCGAGGGRMWFDDPADTRVGRDRVDEIVAAGATTVATLCPFCLTMLQDGLAARNNVHQVRDVAELLVERLDRSSS